MARRAEPTWRSTPSVMRIFVDAEEPPAAEAAVIPANVEIAGMYRKTVESMLEASATFRRQCVRIARNRTLHVTVVRGVTDPNRQHEALTRVVRAGGTMDATVIIGGGPADPAALIAHEFEHILEQLDGVDLALMASRQSSGVRTLSDSGHFETDRAIAAGVRVAKELSAARRRPGM